MPMMLAAYALKFRATRAYLSDRWMYLLFNIVLLKELTHLNYSLEVPEDMQ